MGIHGNLKVWAKEFRRLWHVHTNFNVGSSEGVLLAVRNYLAMYKTCIFSN